MFLIYTIATILILTLVHDDVLKWVLYGALAGIVLIITVVDLVYYIRRDRREREERRRLSSMITMKRAEM
jgi:hypothetical protein